MRVIQKMIKRLRGSGVARNTIWMLTGLGGNSLLQAAAFFLLIRLLGVTEYGFFAGVFALVSTVTPYSSLGTQMIFMRYVSTDHSAARVYWGNLVAVTVTTSLVLIPVLALVGRKLLGPGTLWLIVILVIANCLLSQLTSGASVVFQTFESMGRTAWLRSLSNLARFAFLCILYWRSRYCSTLVSSLAILGSSLIATVAGLIWVRRLIGRMRFKPDLFVRHFGEGVGFSVAGSTQAVYNDVDKMMLSHYGMTAANGIYSFAYRVVDFATIPVNAIDSAILPRYFVLNGEGRSAVLRLARKAIPLAMLSGLLSALITLFAAPWLVRLVGHGFAESVIALRWLCWLPALRGVHQLAGGILTATGLQNSRTAAQFLVALLNVGLNLRWIPMYGWLGAAWSSLICDGALGVISILCVAWLLRNRHSGSTRIDISILPSVPGSEDA